MRMESINEVDGRSLVRSNSSNALKGRSVSLSDSAPTIAGPRYPRVAGGVVLIIVILEKIAFYAFSSNLYLFLNHHPFDWASYNAVTALLVFTGISYASSLIGGWLTDSVFGRYWTICVSFLFYTAGYAFLPIISNNSNLVPQICLWKKSPDCQFVNASVANSLALHDYENPSLKRHQCPSNEPCLWLVYVIIALIGIGSGIFRTIIPPFGADQLKHPTSQTTRTFFNWYYWCINIGGFIGIGGLAYVQQSMQSGFFWSYILSLISLIMAACLLMCNRWNFRIYPKSGRNVFIDTFKIMVEARQSEKEELNPFRDLLRKVEIKLFQLDTSTRSWIDSAKLRYGGNYHESAVEDIKVLGKITLIFVLLVPYWIVYFQMQTTFQAQGLHMKLDPYAPSISRNMSNNLHTLSTEQKEKYKFSIPQAWLILCDTIFVLIFLPVMDRVVFPFLDKRGHHMSLLTRINIGMFLASLSMFTAGVLETYRLRLFSEDRFNKLHVVVQTIGNTTYYAADLWVLWQAPQYALIGLSEVFTTAAGLQFAYSAAPKSVQGVIMGLYYLMSGIGSFLGVGILRAVKPIWLNDKHDGNINYGHMNYYFFLLGGIQLVFFVIFYILKRTKLKSQNENPLIRPNE
ncbi:Solute carrier family 15 member 4 [Nymphon striatum]|nr:Solute carrier family 15 member 4 [Nymphon striatum]